MKKLLVLILTFTLLVGCEKDEIYLGCGDIPTYETNYYPNGIPFSWGQDALEYAEYYDLWIELYHVVDFGHSVELVYEGYANDLDYLIIEEIFLNINTYFTGRIIMWNGFPEENCLKGDEWVTFVFAPL